MDNNTQFSGVPSVGGSGLSGLVKILLILLSVLGVAALAYFGYKQFVKSPQVGSQAAKKSTSGTSLSGKFSFIDCNQLISEAKLSEILGKDVVYGNWDLNSSSFVKTSKPRDYLGKQIENSQEVDQGLPVACPFVVGYSTFNPLTSPRGHLNVVVSKDAASKYESEKKYSEGHSLEEDNKIGKVAAYYYDDDPKNDGINPNNRRHVIFLDDDASVFVEIIIKRDFDMGKAKEIGIEVEKNIK